MSVTVARPNLNDGNSRLEMLKQSGQPLIGAAVMADFKEIDAWQSKRR
jgi:hypothetical protein